MTPEEKAQRELEAELALAERKVAPILAALDASEDREKAISAELEPLVKQAAALAASGDRAGAAATLDRIAAGWRDEGFLGRADLWAGEAAKYRKQSGSPRKADPNGEARRTAEAMARLDAARRKWG